MVKGYRWLALGAAGISLVIPGIARAQAGIPMEQPLGQPAAPSSTGSGLPQAQGSFKAPAPIRPGQAISVLVFPFGFLGAEGGAAAPAAAPGVVTPGGAGAPAAAGLTQEQQHIAGYVTAAVKAGFLSSPFYSVASYHPNSSLIQRAQKDEILRPEQVQNLISPTTGGPDLERARTITYRLGMQGMLVGTIDLKTDAKANTSEVTLETQLINSTTGEVIRSAAVSGAAAGAAGVPLEVVEERAAQDAAQKVLPALGIQLVTLPSEGGNAPKAPSSKTRKSDSNSDKDAKKAAAAAKKADEAAKRQAKEESEKAERAAREQARAAEKAKRDADKKAKSDKSASAAPAPRVQQDAPVAQAAPVPAPAAPAAPVAEAAPEGAVGNTVPGTANAAGQPVPYGYALGDSRSALPQRDRSGLKVPAWMGVAAFLYGLTFLIY